MRISDWRSDVCSSDLLAIGVLPHQHRTQVHPLCAAWRQLPICPCRLSQSARKFSCCEQCPQFEILLARRFRPEKELECLFSLATQPVEAIDCPQTPSVDRQTVVLGMSVSVLVFLGSFLIITYNNL